MTATEPHSPARSAPAAGGAEGLSDASLPESLAILLTGVLPALARGLFSPRRSAIKLLTAFHAHSRAI
jgi:hypothetical protein